VAQAFIAAEDVRFYEHGGVDLVGIVRAMFKNIQAGEIVQGGSTITQQVVKSLLLTPERTFTRKIKEALLAHRIDNSLSKNEILYLYLNQIYFGAGAYGVEAAARTYFDKSASALNLSEAALLAGLPKAPTRFSPIHRFPAARERQRYVLQRMADANFLTIDEARKALAKPLHLSKPKRWTLRELDYFTEEVRRHAEARFGRDMLYKGGLTIHTTLDTRAQRTAEKALDQGRATWTRGHQRYRGLHVTSPRKTGSPALRVLVQTNGDLVEGKVVAGLVRAFDAKTNSCSLDLGQQTRSSAVGLAVDPDFGKAGREGFQNGRPSPGEAPQAPGREHVGRPRSNRTPARKGRSWTMNRSPGASSAWSEAR